MSVYRFPAALILLFAPLCMARPQNVNVAQSGSGNILISTINGVFDCDTMICPTNSVKCSVSRKTTENRSDIETVRKCFDNNGVAVKEESSSEPNPHPGTQISEYSEASRSGSHVIQHFHHGEGDDGAALATNVDDFQKQMREWQEHFQQQMTSFNTKLMEDLHKTFQSSFPKYITHWN